MAESYQKKAKNKEIGSLGEQITAKYLKNKGFSVISMNYAQKYGEIDVITRKNNKIHFVEVKSVSHETKQDLDMAVSHGTWRPEELVHDRKIHQISKALETWIYEHRYEGEWQIDVVAVRMVPREKYARVKYIENVIL